MYGKKYNMVLKDEKNENDERRLDKRKAFYVFVLPPFLTSTTNLHLCFFDWNTFISPTRIFVASASHLGWFSKLLIYFLSHFSQHNLLQLLIIFQITVFWLLFPLFWPIHPCVRLIILLIILLLLLITIVITFLGLFFPLLLLRPISLPILVSVLPVSSPRSSFLVLQSCATISNHWWWWSWQSCWWSWQPWRWW